MIVVVGANGMLGRDLISLLGERARGIDIEDVDITSYESVERVLTALRPSVVINCAAYTDVDGCEANSDQAMSVNGEGVAYLAMATRLLSAIQSGIQRASGRAIQLLRGHAVHFYIHAGFLKNSPRKVVPCAKPGIGGMINSHALLIHQSDDCFGKIYRPGWGAGLIIHHAQLILFSRKFQHGFDKIFALQAIQPLCSDDQMIGIEGGVHLSCQL